MPQPARLAPCLGVVALALVVGCGTTRMTDTQRTATEQLLISSAVDRAVSQLDFRCLAGKPVYFDPQYLDNTVDRGYLIASLRQHLLACGCNLQEDRAKAVYVVEARSGAIGTDRHSLLIGVPQMTIPALVPGQPSQIPEIPLAKKTDQNGVAKIAVCAYNRITGQPVFQSGVVQALSKAKDIWFFGAGPFQNGTIRNGMEFAGHPIPLPQFGDSGNAEGDRSPVVPVTQAAYWPERPARSVPRPLPDLIGAVGAVNPLVSCAILGAWVAAPGPCPPCSPPDRDTDHQAHTEPPILLHTGSKLPADG